MFYGCLESFYTTEDVLTTEQEENRIIVTEDLLSFLQISKVLYSQKISVLSPVYEIIS